jgi:hypothetical protein
VTLGTLIALSTVSACGTTENSPDENRAAPAADVHVVGWPWVDPGADRATAAAHVHVVGWPWVDPGADRATAVGGA